MYSEYTGMCTSELIYLGELISYSV